MDVSVVMTFHDEGPLAAQSLNSMARCLAAARAGGATCEIVAVLDRGARPTREAILRSEARLLEVDNGDLGASRNSGTSAASGRYVAFCDGDDYWSGDSLVSFLRAAERGAPRVLRHEWVVSFGEGDEAARQMSTTDPLFDRESLLVFNPYVSPSFAPREIFEAHPYKPSRFARTGYGFEDWHWLCETVAAGVEHEVVPRTAIFYRRKVAGMLARESAGRAIMAPTSLFAPLNRTDRPDGERS